jgi:DNA mismatch repair protein MutS
LTKKSLKGAMETPLMKQYSAIKAKYPDALLLFRVGDFYETFGDDAIKASNILGIVLTRRANGAASFVELAGFPHHSIDTYLPKLVRAGLRVAICDQLEDPKLAKKIVKRGVTELVTPGVSFNDKVLNHKENNFLASIHLSFKESGISFLDISTGEFYLTQGTNEYLDKLIQSFKPSEIIIQKNKRNQFIEEFGENYYLTSFDDWVFTEDYARDLLLKHFQTNTLKGFGVEDFNMGIIAAGASLHYLAETQHHQSANIRKISRIEEDKYVWLDKFTIRNLELLHSPNENAATLIQVIDKTISPMGSRMMRKWITMPLKIKMSIEERLNVVEYLIDNPELSEIFRENIKLIGDIERLISKVAVGRVNPREVIQLVRGLHAIEKIKDGCAVTNNDPLKKIADQLNPCHVIRNKTEAELEADPPVSINKGHVFRQGVSEELDELRDLLYSGKEYLEKIRKTEAERTGIVSLKIGFNNVFGYYLEVTNAHKDKVPQEWERRQTLVNSERYITQELKEYEEMARLLGYSKVSQMKLAVAKKIRDFVAGGGYMFAMCSAPDSFDIALAADGVDIVESMFDGDPMDPNAQSKLNFDNTLAFTNFTLVTNPNIYEISDIDVTETRPRTINEKNDFFTLFDFSAKWDPVPTMLCQNHMQVIKGFMGQTTAFNMNTIKPNVLIMGEYKAANEARYIHGEYGHGTFTFYGGHDPEDYRHLVGNPPTDLNLHPNSPGYRLILNNVLFPAAKQKKRKT